MSSDSPSSAGRSTSEVTQDTGHRYSSEAKPGGSGATSLELRPGARPVPEYELVQKLGEGGFGGTVEVRRVQ